MLVMLHRPNNIGFALILPPLSSSGGGSERNVWQVGIACWSLVLNSAYQAGVIVLPVVMLLPPTVKALLYISIPRY